ncbi:hypothetical protein TNCV_4973301, partial [Trichonephila clavipes]
ISPKEKSGIDNSVESGGQSPLQMTRSSKNSVKTSILPVMCDTLCHLAVTKIPFVTVQQGYEFRNDAYVYEQSFHWTSLLSSLLICLFVFTRDALTQGCPTQCLHGVGVLYIAVEPQVLSSREVGRMEDMEALTTPGSSLKMGVETNQIVLSSVWYSN